jgi:hypothetical protein
MGKQNSAEELAAGASSWRILNQLGKSGTDPWASGIQPEDEQRGAARRISPYGLEALKDWRLRRV